MLKSPLGQGWGIVKDLMVDIRPADEIWRERSGEDAVTIRIGEGGHYGSVIVSEANARILKAAQALYKAAKMAEDFLTPADEQLWAQMDALDKAEGIATGTRKQAYLRKAEIKEQHSRIEELEHLDAGKE